MNLQILFKNDLQKKYPHIGFLNDPIGHYKRKLYCVSSILLLETNGISLLDAVDKVIRDTNVRVIIELVNIGENKYMFRFSS